MSVFEDLKAYFRYVFDKSKNDIEYKTVGATGERILYNTLRKDLKIPENQLFRNVYVSYAKNKTSEIDLIIVSKKAIFVLECKNYGGKIYGDAKCMKWAQYLGKKKSEFYNPIFQNKTHAKRLNDFLNKNKISVPIIPLVAMVSRGEWKIRNLSKDDYILGINCHLKDIYEKLPDSSEISQNFYKILRILAPLSRPSAEIREQHIKQLK